MRLTFLLLSLLVIAYVHGQDEYMKQKDLKSCQGCVLAGQLLAQQTKGLSYSEALSKVQTLMEDPFQLLTNIPDMGGNLDFHILNSLTAITRAYSADRWDQIRINDFQQLCYRINLCHHYPKKGDNCDDCLEGCCTPWNDCVCGNGINKRTWIRYDNPVLPYLEESQYDRIVSKEEVDAKQQDADKLSERINAAGGIDNYMKQLATEKRAAKKETIDAEKPEKLDSETMIM